MNENFSIMRLILIQKFTKKNKNKNKNKLCYTSMSIYLLHEQRKKNGFILNSRFTFHAYCMTTSMITHSSNGGDNDCAQNPYCIAIN